MIPNCETGHEAPRCLWSLRRAAIEKAQNYLNIDQPEDALDTIHTYYINYSSNIPEFHESCTDQPDCELRFFEATLLVQLGRHDEADTIFRVAISDFPGAPSCYQQVSYYYADRARYADAVFALHQQLLAGYSLNQQQYDILCEAHQNGVAISNAFMARLRHLEQIHFPDYIHPSDLTEILSADNYSYNWHDEVNAQALT